MQMNNVQTPNLDTLTNGWTDSLNARHLSPNTIKLRTYYITRIAQHTNLNTATLTDLQHALATYANRKPETLKTIRASLRSFYEWAHDTGHRTDNPAQKLQPIRIPQTIPHIAPDEDIQTAINNAPLRERAMLQLARLACLRVNEITTLHTSNRHDDHLIIEGKGNKQRRVYLHPDLAATLNELEHQQGPGWYFPSPNGGHLNRITVGKYIKRACGHNPHSLRHAGATAAFRATRDLRAVQILLGHSKIEATQRYLHVDEDGLRAVSLATSFNV